MHLLNKCTITAPEKHLEGNKRPGAYLPQLGLISLYILSRKCRCTPESEPTDSNRAGLELFGLTTDYLQTYDSCRPTHCLWMLFTALPIQTFYSTEEICAE